VSSAELEPQDVAAVLARKAEGDAKALRRLATDPEIDDEIIGFHAQQAAEKWLKAVVASRGVDFEYTHDLRRLIGLAGLESGDHPLDTRQVIALTEYAVPLRYEDLLDAEPLDREATVKLIDEVCLWGKRALSSIDEG